MTYYWVRDMRFQGREIAEQYCMSEGIDFSEIEEITQIDPRTIPMSTRSS